MRAPPFLLVAALQLIVSSPWGAAAIIAKLGPTATASERQRQSVLEDADVSAVDDSEGSAKPEVDPDSGSPGVLSDGDRPEPAAETGPADSASDVTLDAGTDAVSSSDGWVPGQRLAVLLESSSDIARSRAASSLGLSQAAAARAARRWVIGLPALGLSLILVWAAFLMDESTARFFKTLRLTLPIYVSFQLLKMRTRFLPEEEQEARIMEFHRCWAEVPLNIVLRLQGFYIKVAQVASAVPEIMPAPYAENLRVLQENVPPKPFAVIETIISNELGCSCWEVFRSFDEKPVGAASIGQVHMAELRDGTPVAVKVQYPETEHFFRLDFRMLRWMASLVQPDLDPILERIEANFATEFDYRLEGANLRRMCNSQLGLQCSNASTALTLPSCVGGPGATRSVKPPSQVGRIQFPEPFDAFHAKWKGVKKGAKEAKGLVTKRLLVMGRCPGLSLTRLSRMLLEKVAQSKGQTVEEFQADIAKLRKEAMSSSDSSKLEAMLSRGPTARHMALYRNYARVRRGAQNAAIGLLNIASSAFRAGPPKEFVSDLVPPNGPQLLDRIYSAIGYSLFEMGVCNPDPHAGNILFDEESETLSLIDYGQLITLDEDFRVSYARAVVAIVNKDKEGAYNAFLSTGCSLLPQSSKQRVLDEVEFTYALLRAQLDGFKGLLYFMDFVGAKSLREVLDMMVAKRNCPFVKETPTYAMVMRCMNCLKGVGNMLGCMGTSPAEMLFAGATAYLTRRKLPWLCPSSPSSSSTSLESRSSVEQQKLRQQVQHDKAAALA